MVGDIISELDGITLYSAAQVSHLFIDHHFRVTLLKFL